MISRTLRSPGRKPGRLPSAGCVCAENDAGVIGGQRTQRAQAWREQANWQRLRLIEDDNAFGQPVKLAALAWLIRKKRIVELHCGGYDNRSIPVFGCKPD